MHRSERKAPAAMKIQHNQKLKNRKKKNLLRYLIKMQISGLHSRAPELEALGAGSGNLHFHKHPVMVTLSRHATRGSAELAGDTELLRFLVSPDQALITQSHAGVHCAPKAPTAGQADRRTPDRLLCSYSLLLY